MHFLVFKLESLDLQEPKVRYGIPVFNWLALLKIALKHLKMLGISWMVPNGM
jgi:hypothetical protein